MQYQLAELSVIARDLARGHRPPIEVIALIPSPGGDGAAEMLVIRAAAGDAAGLVSIPISRRVTEAALRSTITAALDEFFGHD
jgi:hypothetical protein